MNETTEPLTVIEATIPTPLVKFLDEFILKAGMSMMELADEGADMPDSIPIESWAAGLLITRSLAIEYGPECQCDKCGTMWVAGLLGIDYPGSDDMDCE